VSTVSAGGRPSARYLRRWCPCGTARAAESARRPMHSSNKPRGESTALQVVHILCGDQQEALAVCQGGQELVHPRGVSATQHRKQAPKPGGVFAREGATKRLVDDLAASGVDGPEAGHPSSNRRPGTKQDHHPVAATKACGQGRNGGQRRVALSQTREGSAGRSGSARCVEQLPKRSIGGEAEVLADHPPTIRHKVALGVRRHTPGTNEPLLAARGTTPVRMFAFIFLRHRAIRNRNPWKDLWSAKYTACRGYMRGLTNEKVYET
jgi:hypothetical protein